MNKNEYRRAFIMLRPSEPGCSGHVRLERRTMTGSMYFIVSAQGEDFAAALAGQRGGDYYAAPLGELRRDSRGQLTLASAFDPRNIQGRPLEAYQLIVVVRRGDDGCRILLTGNVDGAHPMDAGAVREAVCALYPSETPAADIPEPAEIEFPAIPLRNSGPEPEPEPEPEPIPEPEPVPEPVPEQIPEPVPEPVPEPTPEPAPEPIPEPEPTPEPTPDCDSEPGHTKIYTRMRVCPIQIRPEPAPRPVAASCVPPLQDGYSYVRVPLPEAAGLDYCLLGVRAEDSRIIAVRCAVPAPYAVKPPEHLPGAVWVGPGAGMEQGHWIYDIPCDDR